MSIVPLQFFRIDGSYIVDLESGQNPTIPTFLPQWLYHRMITKEWECLRVGKNWRAKAKETAGDAVVSDISDTIRPLGVNDI